MKIQYFGDVNDYREFALLRLLAASKEYKVGVCWMMTGADKRRDDENRSYRERPENWRGFDLQSFDAIKAVPNPPSLADLQRIENEKLIPGAVFFDDATPDVMTERKKFHCDCTAKLDAADLVFFDSDNGLQVESRPKGRKGSSKFVYYDEIADFYARGQSALAYLHYHACSGQRFSPA